MVLTQYTVCWLQDSNGVTQDCLRPKGMARVEWTFFHLIWAGVVCTHVYTSIPVTFHVVGIRRSGRLLAQKLPVALPSLSVHDSLLSPAARPDPGDPAHGPICTYWADFEGAVGWGGGEVDHTLTNVIGNKADKG